LNKVFYLDFYAIERFGKTRLGTLLHFAKQGQNKYLMNILISEIKAKVDTFIKINKIDAIAYVPPTIKREVQIMKFIKEHLNIALPLISINKISGIIPIPQKSLSKINERINNAKSSFAITEQRKFNKILLIDDAVGSGATLNYIAEKIKIKKIAKQVIGLAIVGSFKGFDVITDI
jgi:predicted amidophosphoribosyltransferase